MAGIEMQGTSDWLSIGLMLRFA